MALYFEKGSRDAPKGHALLFFRHRDNHQDILATYLVTLPITVDMTKYIPPMFMAQMQSMATNELSGFAFPPVPEKVPSFDNLVSLADLRGDDLLDGGLCNSDDPMGTVQVVNEIQEEYTKLYQDTLSLVKVGNAELDLPKSSVNEVLYELMGEKDKLGELSKLIGKLRFAAEGSDSHMVRETQEEIEALGKYLPDHYKLSNIVVSAEMPLSEGGQLAQLYLERCYKLHEEDYIRVQQVDSEIKYIEESL